MPQAPSNASYQKILSTIGKIYVDAQARSKEAVNKIIVEAYWEIGQQIVMVEQGTQWRAKYGDQLMENLAQDLTDKYGSGFSKTNLKYMRRFFKSAPKGHARAQLSWTHHRQLLNIKDEKLRQYYTNEAVKHQWSSRDLDRYLKLDKIEREGISGQKSPLKATSPSGDLKIQRGRLFCYRVTTPPVTVKTEKSLFLDLGFSTFKEFIWTPPGPLKKGDIVEALKNKQEIVIKKPRAEKKDIFTYVAYLERIVDGDTLLCWMDLGFGQWTRQYLRLRFIDAPEAKTARGQKSKAFVHFSLQEAPFLVVKTYATDLYDRYLADIFYIPHEKNPHTVAREGRYLNQDLLDQKLAIRA